MEKQVGSATPTVYIFSGTKVIAEYNLGAAAASPNREYIYVGSSLLATIQGTTTTYHHPDHLSVRLDTDASGNVVGQQGHYPFGESGYATGATTKWQFTGYERDSESSNDYATARSYVNRFARLSSPDPLAGNIVDPQSLNRYSYVRSDPVNLVDPLGLITCEADFQVVSCSMLAPLLDMGAVRNISFMTPFDFETGNFWDESLFSGTVGYYLDCEQGGSALLCEQLFYGPSCGGGGGGSIQKTRSALLDALLRDPDCLSFLGARVANLLETLAKMSIQIGNSSNSGSDAATRLEYGNPASSIPTSSTTYVNGS